MTRVIIVDDHQSMRESLCDMFAKMEGYTVVADIPSAALAPLFCKKFNADLLLLDICTEGNASGLTAAKEIRESCPDVKIILMTAFNEITYLPRAKEAGAHAFLYKQRSLEFFAKVVEDVMAGEKYFPEPMKVALPSGEIPLTERELEILRLVCKHMTNKEIGAELFISENTVKYHKSKMLAKTGFETTVELAFYMLANGFINPLF
ncbi:MAG: response regulator transcription factor [Eubacteriales bacterium]|nr:response regulator transcription factor [Eubacteriales bacterium]